MKHKVLCIAALLCLLLTACNGTPAETTEPTTIPAETTLPVETTQPVETTLPVETEPLIETEPPETTEPLFDFSVPHLTVYIANQSIDWYTYSIAPAGTEDWLPLTYTGLVCYGHHEEPPHGAWVQLKYAAPYDGEPCTTWRLKLEVIPEDVEQRYGNENAEYSIEIIENVEIRDGMTVLSWFGTLQGEGISYPVSRYPGCFFTSSEMIFCDYCSEEFRASYQSE